MLVRHEGIIVRPRLLFAAGLGVPMADTWIDSTEEGEEKALAYLKKHTDRPAYVFEVVKQWQARVDLYEIEYT